MVFDSVYEMTNYLKSPTVTPTLTFESDFTSTSGWTSTDSKFAINTGQDALIANNDQVTDNLQIGYDLTSISDTAWILDFDLKIVSLTSAGSMWTHIGMFSVNTSVNDDQTQNFLGLILLGENAQGANTNSILLADQQGGSLGGAGILTSGLTLTGTPQYYLRLKRTASNKLTIENYSSSARTGTPSTTVTRTLGDNPQSLRYLKVSNRTVSGSGELNIKIENMKFYNGVTSLLPYPKPRGQHFWEYFSGGSLNSRWSSHGSGSASITGDGMLLTSPTNGAQSIDLSPSDAGKIRPFSPTGAVMIVTSKLVQAQYSNQSNGFRTNYYTEAGKYVIMAIQGQTNGNSGDNKIQLKSNNPSTSVDTTLASSAIHDWHTYKLELLTASSTLNVDGLLQVTGSCNPDTRCQPYLNMATAEGTISGGAKANYRYCEVYNT